MSPISSQLPAQTSPPASHVRAGGAEGSVNKRALIDENSPRVHDGDTTKCLTLIEPLDAQLGSAVQQAAPVINPGLQRVAKTALAAAVPSLVAIPLAVTGALSLQAAAGMVMVAVVIALRLRRSEFTLIDISSQVMLVSAIGVSLCAIAYALGRSATMDLGHFGIGVLTAGALMLLVGAQVYANQVGRRHGILAVCGAAVCVVGVAYSTFGG